MDGYTHINVYSKGETEIGKFYSNFAYSPFKCEDGEFASIEAYWYWIRTGGKSPRHTFGYKAKEYGKKFPIIQEIDIDKIKKAIDIKMRIYRRFIRENEMFDLHLEHYYVYGGKQKDGGYNWLIDHIEKRREQLKEYFNKKK